ncbi:MAG: bifunctional methylenetetrahydrofolate dehydrogenase/methenyltetrahydrofolate cyclohydrolase FolD [Deltaproteobacteria bacterium]|nr:bifunctional methylenetetrahydrofolate dehydrogenase/methenyltetrahydrofolate cyclohydrolase FolD [Deltaproteobacteria bacterium]
MSSNATILDGKLLARLLETDLKQRVEKDAAQYGRKPGLAVILVGNNPASQYYVRTKEKVAKRAGLKSFDTRLPEDASFEQVAEAIKSYNQNPEVDGILLQLPVPRHLNSDKLLDLIDPAKDADGLHPHNQGLLMTGKKGVRPCTPLGTVKLLDLALSGVDISQKGVEVSKIPEADLSGKSAVVVGRSILVGKPVSLLLLDRNATVTLAHSRTDDLAAVCKKADIVVAAVGVPGLVKGDWIKPGAIVLDVGINRLPDGSLTGDVEFDEAAKRAAAITPVPGGVGPMTVMMLIYNTYLNYNNAMGKS